MEIVIPYTRLREEYRINNMGNIEIKTGKWTPIRKPDFVIIDNVKVKSDDLIGALQRMRPVRGVQIPKSKVEKKLPTGVSFDKHSNRYKVRMTYNNQQVTMGYAKSEAEAIKINNIVSKNKNKTPQFIREEIKKFKNKKRAKSSSAVKTSKKKKGPTRTKKITKKTTIDEMKQICNNIGNDRTCIVENFIPLQQPANCKRISCDNNNRHDLMMMIAMLMFLSIFSGIITFLA